MEGRRAHAVAHLAYARSQKSGTGILGSKRVLQGGEKSSPLSVLRDLWLVYGVYGVYGLVEESVVQGEKPRVWVKPWWREMWSVEQNRGFGSNLGGGKCGPGSKTAGLGQTLVAGSVVRGAKSRVWVKLWWREVWSVEQNRGFGSNFGGGKCGPWSKIAGLGQARPRRSVVQGEKPRVWVKPWWREMWSREQNRGFGSSLGGGKCGPGRETAGLGQTLVAGNVVQGEKLRVWAKPWWREMWSRERNRGFGSTPAPPECGPGRETAPPGQTRPRRSVVRGVKPRPRVKPGPAAVWSRERNCGPGSNPAPPQCGPGRETAPPGQARLRRSMVRGAKPRPGSTPAPPEYGPGRETAAPGQTRPRPSVVQGAKPRPGSNPAPPKHGPRT